MSQKLVIFGQKIRQHEFRRCGNLRRPPYAQTYSDEVAESQRITYGSYAFVASITTSNLNANLARLKIEVIMDDNHAGRIRIDAAQQRGDSLAAQVHEGLGLGQDQVLVLYSRAAHFSVFPVGLPDSVRFPCKLVDHHEPKVMAVTRV